jgi:hypothetical protein
MQKIISTFLLTGLGYGATLLYTYTILANATAETLSRLNKYESVLAIITGLISLGVVQDTSRNIATNPSNWERIYQEAQQLRLALAILISIISISAFLATTDEIYLLGLATLSMALSGEYALYALGRPISGSIASFLRAIIFSALIIITVLFIDNDLNAITITIACSLSFIACGIIASRQLRTNYIPKPKISNITTIKTIGTIALFMFFYNNIKPAIILLIPKSLSPAESAYYFEAYKLFFIFFSIRRVLVQTLYKEIINNINSLKYDFIITGVMLGSLLGIWLLKYIINATDIMKTGFSYEVLIDVTLVTTMSCVFSSSFTRLFALKKDLAIGIPILISAFAIFVGMKTFPPEETSIRQYFYMLGASELILSCVSFLLLKFLLVKK